MLPVFEKRPEAALGIQEPLEDPEDNGQTRGLLKPEEGGGAEAPGPLLLFSWAPLGAVSLASDGVDFSRFLSAPHSRRLTTAAAAAAAGGAWRFEAERRRGEGRGGTGAACPGAGRPRPCRTLSVQVHYHRRHRRW